MSSPEALGHLPSPDTSDRRPLDVVAAAVGAAVPTPVVVTDGTGTIVWSTAAFQHLIGDAHPAGRDLAAALGTSATAQVAAGIAAGHGRVPNLLVQGATGETRWLDLEVGALPDGAGVAGHRVIACTDVTDRAMLEARLNQEDRLAVMGALAAGVAHEIATPIQYVGDSVQFLSGALDDLARAIVALQAVRRAASESRLTTALVEAAVTAEEDADLAYLLESLPTALESCVEGLDRVGAMVRSLKETTHPQQDRMATTSLNDVIQRSLTLARNEYKYVADVTTDLGEVPPVMCVAGSISQVVLNLVVNASHAIADLVAGTKDRGTITVATRVDGPWVVVSVSDSGGGIPDAVRHRIFEPFFTTKPLGKGTGQGLAIARRIVEDTHAGSIAVESSPGRGTTFEIRLPISGPAECQGPRVAA